MEEYGCLLCQDPLQDEHNLAFGICTLLSPIFWIIELQQTRCKDLDDVLDSLHCSVKLRSQATAPPEILLAIGPSNVDTAKRQQVDLITATSQKERRAGKGYILACVDVYDVQYKYPSFDLKSRIFYKLA